MQRRASGAASLFFASALALSLSLSAGTSGASASEADGTQHKAHPVRSAASYRHHTRVVFHGISCVPYARSKSGIDLPGNAGDWWDNAAGVYARGDLPQPGSVLAFRANPRMRLGHVAVVERVINRREVEVDQANWGRPGRVSEGVAVVDVSEDNDWSAVRVEIGDRGEFGAIYPTYGFIYHQPDNGVVLMAAAASAPAPQLNPAAIDLRSFAERDDEVAEAPAVEPVTPRPHYKRHHHYKAAAHHSSSRRHEFANLTARVRAGAVSG